MSHGVRSVSDLVNGLRIYKMTVHHATSRSHAKAFITSLRLNRNSLSFHLLKNMYNFFPLFGFEQKKYSTQLLPIVQGCIMTLTQGHISNVKGTEHSYM